MDRLASSVDVRGACSARPEVELPGRDGRVPGRPTGRWSVPHIPNPSQWPSWTWQVIAIACHAATAISIEVAKTVL